MSATNLQSITYTNEGGMNPKLAVLDQLLVPHEKQYIPIVDVEGAWSVIRLMQIRGMVEQIQTTKCNVRIVMCSHSR